MLSRSPMPTKTASSPRYARLVRGSKGPGRARELEHAPPLPPLLAPGVAHVPALLSPLTYASLLSSQEELRALLANIGANMSDDDILALMALGSEDGKGIPNKTFLKLLG
mmetsp:Transcript_11356/g.34405  ORF Transcript_11356/g.34405 Transcript_11356/m.34405 type:complete len:110 (-) Transcript_11356:285-614(-)